LAYSVELDGLEASTDYFFKYAVVQMKKKPEFDEGD